MVLIKDREVLLDTLLDKRPEEEVHQNIHLIEVTAEEVCQATRQAEAIAEEVLQAIRLAVEVVVAQEALVLTQARLEAQVDLAQEVQEAVALALQEVYGEA